MKMKTKPKAVICVAAGKSQVIVIQKAREMGFCVISIDRNPDAPGFQYSDEKIICSTYDADEVIRNLHPFADQYRFTGVINRSSGFPVITTAKICEAFSLPGISPGAAETIVDKSKLMRFCAVNHISAPQCLVLGCSEKFDIKKITFPCIIKPSLSLVGKSGVIRVASQKDLYEALPAAKSASLNGFINIEEFVPGDDITLMAFVQKRELFPLALLDEHNRMDSDGRITGSGFSIPSKYTGSNVENDILSIAKRVVQALKLDTTAFNMSCRLSKDSITKLIEIHLDLGGDLIIDALWPNSTSFDFLHYAINILTDETCTIPRIGFKPKRIVFDKGDQLVTDREYHITSTSHEKEMIPFSGFWSA